MTRNLPDGSVTTVSVILSVDFVLGPGQDRGAPSMGKLEPDGAA